MSLSSEKTNLLTHASNSPAHAQTPKFWQPYTVAVFKIGCLETLTA